MPKNSQCGSLLLTVADLTVEIVHRHTPFIPVNQVSFTLHKGESLALVGESGSGKTMTALAIMGLLPPKARRVAGTITFDGLPVSSDGDTPSGSLRGRNISMIFQEPVAALNPVFTIGTQMSDVIRRHTGTTAATARQRIMALCRQVGLPDPEFIFRAYPHQLSGGMAQRCMIAMALSCNPHLVIADEPTTALDVTTQQQILALLAQLQKRHQFALLLISHDLKVVDALADRVAVMKDGKILEINNTEDIMNQPSSAYTSQLIESYFKLTETPESV